MFHSLKIGFGKVVAASWALEVLLRTMLIDEIHRQDGPVQSMPSRLCAYHFCGQDEGASNP